MSGIKHDAEKPKLSLVSFASLKAETRAMQYGANKYGKDNYKGGMDWSRLIDAALRHIYAFQSGETYDTESGLSHIDHAKANLGMLAYYFEHKVGKDDR